MCLTVSVDATGGGNPLRFDCSAFRDAAVDAGLAAAAAGARVAATPMSESRRIALL